VCARASGGYAAVPAAIGDRALAAVTSIRAFIRRIPSIDRGVGLYVKRDHVSAIAASAIAPANGSRTLGGFPPERADGRVMISPSSTNGPLRM
jgi:hypothetical protein